MLWTLMFISIFPIFQLDRFTRRDIRKYNREIRKIEKESIKLLERDRDMLQELLLRQRAGLVHIQR